MTTIPDYQTTFRTGAAYGRFNALGETLRDMYYLLGVLNAGGQVSPTQYKELLTGVETQYADASEKYRTAANLPA
jgi:hypothetical protein